jgi:hypothetical protein
MLVIPNLMGISIWSPRLDQVGNSVRGVEFCERLVETFSFHQYDSLMGHSTKLNPRRKENELMPSKVMELIRSASHGDLDEILRLEAEGVSADVADYDGRTPLHLAACEGQIEVVRHLIARKVHLMMPLNSTMKIYNHFLNKPSDLIIMFIAIALWGQPAMFPLTYPWLIVRRWLFKPGCLC